MVNLALASRNVSQFDIKRRQQLYSCCRFIETNVSAVIGRNFVKHFFTIADENVRFGVKEKLDMFKHLAVTSLYV